MTTTAHDAARLRTAKMNHGSELPSGGSAELGVEAIDHATGTDVQPLQDARISQLYAQASRYFRSGGVERMEAEDLALETCLRLLAQIERGRTVGDGWVLTVERHLLVDRYRSRAREEKALRFYQERVALGLRSALGAEQRERLAECLATLRSDERQLLQWRYVEGLSIGEVAARLALSPDCVKQRLHRARKRLRTLWLRDKEGVEN